MPSDDELVAVLIIEHFRCSHERDLIIYPEMIHDKLLTVENFILPYDEVCRVPEHQRLFRRSTHHSYHIPPSVSIPEHVRSFADVRMAIIALQNNLTTVQRLPTQPVTGNRVEQRAVVRVRHVREEIATLPFLYGRLVHRFGIAGAIISFRAAGKKNRSSSGNSKVQCH